MRRSHLRVHLLLTFLACILLFTTLASAQDKENDTLTQDLPESTFTPSTPSQGGNNTGSFCVAGYSDCSTIGRRDACCTLTEVCTFDDSGRVGCCEFGVKCVGEIPLKDNSGATPCWKGIGLSGLMTWTAVVAALVTGGEVFGSVVTL